MESKKLVVIICMLVTASVFSIVTSSVASDGNIIYVDDDNTQGPWDGTQEHPYQYIQDGIDVASDSDTIFVYDGTYHEMIVIDKSITLQGEDKTCTIIDGCGGELLKEDVVYIKADRVNMSGFTIKNSAQGYSYEAGIAMKEANHCVITDNILTENEWGMDVRDSQYNSITDNVISSSSGGIHLCFSYNNLVSNCTIEQIEVRGISIYVSAGNTIVSNSFVDCGLEIYNNPSSNEENLNTIVDNTVNGKPLVYLENESNVIIDDAGQVILLNCEDITVRNLDLYYASTGVRVVDSKRITISSNIISNNVHGISIVESQHVVIEENIIEDNWGTGVGIYYTFTEKIEILNNTITNNGKGIYVFNCLSGKTIIKNNEISNNEEGIDISSRSCDISWNNICDNSEYGVIVWNSKGNQIYANNFERNGVHAYFEYFREIGGNKWNTLNKGNYWDDWDGTGPKVIRGKQIVIALGPSIGIPWFNFDWHPAKEPYEADSTNLKISNINDDKWMQTYGGFNDDMGISAQQTSDGGYIVVGETSKSILIFENSDVWLIKTDDKGNILWDQTFGGSEDDRGSFVMQTNDNGYIITGNTKSYSNGKTDVWLIKTNEDGEKIWDKTFGYSDFDSGSEVKQTNDGGYIIVGNVNTSGGGLGDVWLIKVDSDGNKLWDKCFGGKGHNYGDSIQQTIDGGYIILGSSWVPDETNSYDIWLIKTDSDGEMLWDKKYHGTDSDHGWSLQQTSDGGFIVVGMTKAGDGSDDIWLFKTDNAGVMLWDKIFGGVGQNRGYSVKQTNDGGFIIAGDTYKNLRMKALLIKTDSNGNMEWNKTYSGLGNDIFFSVQQTDDNGYILTGYKSTLRYSDLWLVKTDSEGNAPTKYIRNPIMESDMQNTINNNEGKALIASIYIELDPNSLQVQEIIDNYNSPPRGFLTNIDIIVPDPNDEDGEWFFIAPFFRTLIGQWIGIGPFFDVIAPTETTTVHIKLLWGDVHFVDWPPEEDKPDEFIIDGWAPLLSWEY